MPDSVDDHASPDDASAVASTAGRFAKGKSGNPQGRPRKTQSVDDVLLGAAHERVPIKVNGKSKRVTKIDAAARQMANQSAMGDPRATKMLIEHTQKAEARKAAAPVVAVLGPSDLEIVERMKQRWRLIIAEEPDGSDVAG